MSSATFKAQLFVLLFMVAGDVEDLFFVIRVSFRSVLCHDDLIDILLLNSVFHEIDPLFIVCEFALITEGIEEYEKGVDGVFVSLTEILELVAGLLYSGVVLKDGLELLLELIPRWPRRRG